MIVLLEKRRVFSLEEKAYKELEMDNKAKKWNFWMTIGFVLLLIALLLFIKYNNELGFILTTIPTGGLYAGLHFHFKKIKSYKEFKIKQLVILGVFFIAIVIISVFSEILDSTSGAVFIIVFLGSKELVDYIIEGVPVIKNEPKKQEIKNKKTPN